MTALALTAIVLGLCPFLIVLLGATSIRVNMWIRRHLSMNQLLMIQFVGLIMIVAGAVLLLV